MKKFDVFINENLLGYFKDKYRKYKYRDIFDVIDKERVTVDELADFYDNIIGNLSYKDVTEFIQKLQIKHPYITTDKEYKDIWSKYMKKWQKTYSYDEWKKDK